MDPSLSVIVPTRDRPHLLRLAVESALAQTTRDIEVVVVDDGSVDQPSLPGDPRLRVVRHQEPSGGAAARNTGTSVARGRWITYLDDDDELLPTHAELALEALAVETELPPPVAVLTAVEVVDARDAVLEVRLPPTLPRGSHYNLEPARAEWSFHVKQTLVAPRQALADAGGWDPAFRSRVHTDLFLRLNPVCSLRGVPEVTYRLRAHDGPRVSGRADLRRDSFRQLVEKHAAVLESHPTGYADMLVAHARVSRRSAMRQESAWAWQRALAVAPRRAGRALAHSAVEELRSRRTNWRD